MMPEGKKLIADVYPVGFLFDLKMSWRVKRYRMAIFSMIGWFFTGKWRRLRSHLNGYLAEPLVFPGKLKRCGTGWTRRSAVRDLQRMLNKS
jgi:hypothetical protein